MYIEKQFLIMLVKCVSTVVFGSGKPKEEKCLAEEGQGEPQHHNNRPRSSWFVLHWLRTSVGLLRGLRCLTPRRLDIAHSKCLSDRAASPACKLGQMERSDAFTLPTPTNSTHYFAAAAAASDSSVPSISSLGNDLQLDLHLDLQTDDDDDDTVSASASASASTSTATNNTNSRPNWESASSSASTLTSCDLLSSASALLVGDDCRRRTDRGDEGESEEARSESTATGAGGGRGEGELEEDGYIWDEMSTRVDELLKQELNESEDLEKTVADAEEHCYTVSQIHDMATRIKVLMDENDRLTQNLLIENLKHSTEEEGAVVGGHEDDLEGD